MDRRRILRSPWFWIVAVDALPVELPYVEKGLAPVLLAQPTYLWGHVSVSTVVVRSPTPSFRTTAFLQPIATPVDAMTAHG